MIYGKITQHSKLPCLGLVITSEYKEITVNRNFSTKTCDYDSRVVVQHLLNIFKFSTV